MVDSTFTVDTVVRTLRFKVRPDSYSWLAQAATETNLCWNFCNEVSFKAARPFAGRGKWLTGYDLCNLSSGATDYFEHIGADTIQRVATEYAAKRAQAKKAKLRWRVSSGSKRSLGWVPFKAASIRRKGKYFRFCGKAFRVFEPERFAAMGQWKSGCFAQDAVGDWYICLPVSVAVEQTYPAKSAVGIDLGLKDIAVTSDGERLEAARFYRDLEAKIAQAQRRGHRRQAKFLHRTAARRRLNALHQFSRKLVDQYQTIIVGDVSSLKLVKTQMAKSVLDSGWGILKAQLQWKGQQAGRCVKIVSEVNSSRTCSSCGSLTGPRGVNGLRVRSWMCPECGSTQDRDVNAARNILAAGRCLPSVRGNDPTQGLAPPSRASRPREAWKVRDSAAA
jgi:putative transposase